MPPWESGRGAKSLWIRPPALAGPAGMASAAAVGPPSGVAHPLSAKARWPKSNVAHTKATDRFRVAIFTKSFLQQPNRPDSPVTTLIIVKTDQKAADYVIGKDCVTL